MREIVGNTVTLKSGEGHTESDLSTCCIKNASFFSLCAKIRSRSERAARALEWLHRTVPYRTVPDLSVPYHTVPQVEREPDRAVAYAAPAIPVRSP
jgi:hypothetical protein